MIQRSNQWFALAALLGYLLVVGYYTLKNPLYTWDTVPYIATTLESIGSDAPTSLHSQTYSYLQKHLSPDQFNSLISGPYAADLHLNPEHFASQLNMYRIKPAYVASLKVLGLAGVDPLVAVLLLSLIPGLLICLLLFHWLSHYVNPLQAVLITVLFSVSARIIDLGRVPVPDNYSALVILAGLYTLIIKRWFTLAVGLLCFSILIRTNNILFVGLLLLWQSWAAYSVNSSARHKEFTLFASGFIISCISYFAVSQIYDYQWWRLFYHTFVESQPDIEGFSIGFSLDIYLLTLKNAIRQVAASGAFIATSLPLFLLAFFVSFTNYWTPLLKELRTPGEIISIPHITMLCIPVFGAFFLLFPLAVGWDRFFLPYYALITVFAVKSYSSTH